MQLSDFDFELPKRQIASAPLPNRTDSRLMLVSRSGDLPVKHSYFKQILTFLQPGDLLVLNNSKVIKARLFGVKETGGKLELLVERILAKDMVLAHIKSSKALQIGSKLTLAKDLAFVVLGRDHGLYQLRYLGTEHVLSIIEEYGNIPLPPYMERDAVDADLERYQTVYAKHDGSVAAPTAGLHFSQDILQQIQQIGVKLGYVTLHVGAGTFQPVRTDSIKEHTMHSEWLEVSDDLCDMIVATKAAGKRVIAVGTTVVRSLETAASSGDVKPYCGDSNLFIYPGYTFNCIDAMLTNFHLPRSSLLMLVAAFAGYKNIMTAYRAAVAADYRFFSYGDCMLIA